MSDLIRRHEDQTFVRAAYLALLGREADASGLETYTDLLREGMRKSEIVWALATSDEGRQLAATRRPADLDGLLKAENARQHPGLLQRMWRRLVMPATFAQAEEAQRELRVAANRGFLIEQSVERMHKDLQQAHAEIVQIKELLAPRGQQGAAFHFADGTTQNDVSGLGHDVVPPRASALLHAMRRYAAARFGRVH